MSRSIPPLQCVWQGLPLTVIRITDTSAHRWVEHAYPGQDGVELETMGAEPRRFEVEALFFGVDWFADMVTFMGSVEQPGSSTPGMFLHPFLGTILGCIPQASCVHEDRKHDCAIVRFTLVEGKLVPFAFTTTTSLASAASAAESASSAATAATAALP